MINSAKQSMVLQEKWIASSPVLLAMTADREEYNEPEKPA
jgi:hypothetical protein